MSSEFPTIINCARFRLYIFSDAAWRAEDWSADGCGWWPIDFLEHN